MRFRMLGKAGAIGIALLLVACAKSSLSTRSVSEFVDAADQAFLRGDAIAICKDRAPAFFLQATEFKLAGNQRVTDFAQAEAIAKKRQDDGELLGGESITMERRAYCAMVVEQRNFYKRATMERGSLNIQISADGKQAVVKAHYTVKEPIYDYGDSPHGTNERVEHQVGTRQSESDDESVVALQDGELKFVSTKSVTKSFLVAKERDRNL